MTDAKYAAGPWSIEDMGLGVIEVCTVPGIDDDLIPIAEIIHDGEWTEEHTANANLIAAAPELLEAAQHAVRWHAGQLGFCNCDWCRPMKAAIAKATGRQELAGSVGPDPRENSIDYVRLGETPDA